MQLFGDYPDDVFARAGAGEREAAAAQGVVNVHEKTKQDTKRQTTQAR